MTHTFAPLPTLALAAALLALPPVTQAQPTGGIGSAFRPQTLPAVSSPVSGPANPASAAAPATPGGESGLRVVVSGGKQALAAIDGRLVRVGDRINGMRVSQIGPHGVVLTGEGGTREELKLHPAAEKKPAMSTRVSQGARP